MIALYELIEMIPDSVEPILSNRLKILFNFLREQERRMSEKEACIRFSGTPTKKKHFNRLKNDLKRELVSYIVSDASTWGGSDRKSLHKACYRKFAAYKLLLLSGKRTAAIETAKSLLPQLIAYELFSLTHTTAIDLRFHYSSMDISKALAESYNRICDKTNTLLHAEATIRQLYSRSAIIRHTRKSYTAAIIHELDTIANEALTYLSLGSHYLNRFIYNMVLFRYLIVFDYAAILKHSDKALATIPENHPNRNALRFNYLQMKIPSLVALGHLKQAKELAKQCSSMMPIGNFNWHLALLRRITVCFYAQEYQEAYDLYKAHRQKECPFPLLAEYWQILWGYLYILISRGKIEQYSEERFHLGRFLNQLPIHSKDKAGNNINLLIIQIIIRMQREEYGKIIDQIESLKKYVQKYTKAKTLQRANVFIRMLIAMENASFHRSRTEQKTLLLHKKLQQLSLKLDQNLSVEVIPYEILWQEILLMLENKFRATRTRRSKKSMP